jgi:hypothetical protein
MSSDTAPSHHRNSKLRSRYGQLSLLSVVLLLTASTCDPLIATYNVKAYENATSLKAEASIVMKKATEPFADHEETVGDLMLGVEQAYEFVNGIPNNSDSAAQWRILKDPDEQLLGGFMNRWETNDTLSAAFIKNHWDDNVGPAFDEIIKLENGKLGKTKK